ncbi:MAG: hypothetical protein V2A61_02245 [Calditrichota bacterium]
MQFPPSRFSFKSENTFIGGPTFRHIIALILLLLVLLGSQYLLTMIQNPQPQAPGLDDPTPALGETVASAVHQALTDPYFAPLERMGEFLEQHPNPETFSVDLLTKWVPDDEFPTCFVLDANKEGIQVDHPSSPWVLEQLVRRIREGHRLDNPQGRLQVAIFNADNQKFWTGFLSIPLGSPQPKWVAGVFFSLDRYLESDVPRLLDRLINRQRFPLVAFENTGVAAKDGKGGHISLRILNASGEVYLQRGQTFDPDKMLYAESKWYPEPIVCLQKKWDLQIFSSRAKLASPLPQRGFLVYLVMAISALAAIIIFWWGSRRPHPKEGKIHG